MWGDLADDVRAELEDPLYKGRTHYKKATYAVGCRGPLCRKLERDEARANTARKAIEAGREYVPRQTDAQARDEELDRVIDWHLAERKTAAAC
jgi:hypothetical protein